jgi:hypothetical protein
VGRLGQKLGDSEELSKEGGKEGWRSGCVSKDKARGKGAGKGNREGVREDGCKGGRKGGGTNVEEAKWRTFAPRQDVDRCQSATKGVPAFVLSSMKASWKQRRMLHGEARKRLKKISQRCP